MTDSKPVRLCEFCKSPISSMRGVRAKFCSSQCNERQFAAKRRKERDPSLVIVHSCLSSEFDNFDISKCRCRWYLGDKKIEGLFKQNAVRNLNPSTRSALHWDRGDVFLIGKRVRTPRGASIERAHIVRGVQRFNLKQQREKSPEQMKAEVEDLRRRIAHDQLEKDEDEKHRWEVWADLQQQFYASLTTEYSESEWLDMEQTQATLPVYVSGIGNDERSSIGRSVKNSIEPTNGIDVDTAQEEIRDGFEIVDADCEKESEDQEELEKFEEAA
jgi:hypothetical protein